MRVLFLTLIDFDSFDECNIYTDLLREFIDNKHEVYCISPVERRTKIKTHFKENGHILRLRIGNMQKTTPIEKGISTLLLERQYVSAVKKYFSDIKFDLVLYTTPPITLLDAVKFVKNRDGAKTYLMLKDIFPQNAVDLGMIKTTGIKGLLYKYFRRKEKELYSLSDRIGCMSQANIEYVLTHNPEITEDRVESCPNCIKICDVQLSEHERIEMREKYGLPKDKKVFVYGGNLGKPQGVRYIIDCLKACADIKDSYFVIAGSGTDRWLLEKYLNEEKPSHVKLLEELPKQEYDSMVAACDVGMIFLDHRFTIPNFPSRLLSYMQAGIPVFACTDPVTDIGKVIVDGGFGVFCESNDVSAFREQVKYIMNADHSLMVEREKLYLNEHYAVEKAYSTIMQIE